MMWGISGLIMPTPILILFCIGYFSEATLSSVFISSNRTSAAITAFEGIIDAQNSILTEEFPSIQVISVTIDGFDGDLRDESTNYITIRAWAPEADSTVSQHTIAGSDEIVWSAAYIEKVPQASPAPSSWSWTERVALSLSDALYVLSMSKVRGPWRSAIMHLSSDQVPNTLLFTFKRNSKAQSPYKIQMIAATGEIVGPDTVGMNDTSHSPTLPKYSGTPETSR